MDNFTFCSPTLFVFGRDQENNAGKYVKQFGGTKVLLRGEVWPSGPGGEFPKAGGNFLGEAGRGAA